MHYFIASISEFVLSNNDNIIAYMNLILILALFSLLLIPLQTVIHEGGHCIFGLLTGYRLLSFRIFSVTLIKENGKLQIKRYEASGSQGQCIMIPSFEFKDNYPRIFYHMGGIIADLIVSIISVFIIMGPPIFNCIERFIGIYTFIFFFGSVIINGVPSRKRNINNDGLVLQSILKNGQARVSDYYQRELFNHLYKGNTYRDFPKEKFQVSAESDLSNVFIAWHKIYEGYYYMDIKQWDKALACISTFDDAKISISRAIRITVIAEMLFLYIELGKNPSEIEDLYSSIKKLLKKCRWDYNLVRVRIAYEMFKDRSDENKARIRKELLTLNKYYPYKGEAIFCSRLVNEMLDK